MKKLNVRAKQVFELMEKYSLKNNIKKMGSEFLILAMYETEDTLCHFLLDEFEITREDIEKKTLEFIHKKELEDYNSSLKGILRQAKMVAGNRSITEEHLFISVFLNEDNIAFSILKALNLNLDDLMYELKLITEG